MAQSVGLTIFLIIGLSSFSERRSANSFIASTHAAALAVKAPGILGVADGGSPPTEVLTTYGTVRGKIQRIRTSKQRNADVKIFIGIPYARPPLGDLRFKNPQEPERWQGVLNTTDRQVLCPQTPSKYAPQTTIRESEDCLYLNVFAKQTRTNNNPVFVYFHGGEFSYGGKDFYSPDYLLEKDVVVVIANYRLGIFGFFSTGNREVPGNAGLHDQVMVLQWVKMNIDRFGGNPNNITIWGHDAGGISVSLHLLSRRSRGLFSAAISSSGTAFVPGAVRQNFWTLTSRVARKFACSTKSTYDLVTCLRKRDYRELIEAVKTYGQFGPVIEKDSPSPFLNNWPFQLYWAGDYHKVPYISGVTRNEGTLEYFDRISEARKELRPEKIIAAFLRPRLPPQAPVDVIAITCKFHYNLRFLNTSSFTTSNNNLTELVSDFLYKSANDLAVKLHSKGGASTYMYVFEPTNAYRGPSLAYLSNIDNVKREEYGVAHMDDMFYMFRTEYDTHMPGGSVDDQTAATIRNNFANMWYSFAQKGVPTTYGQNAAVSSHRIPYLRIPYQSIPQLGMDYRQYDMDFWNEMVLDLILQSTNPTQNPLSSQVERLENFESATWGMVGVVVVLVILCVALVAVIVANRRRSAHNLKLISRSVDRDLDSRETPL